MPETRKVEQHVGAKGAVAAGHVLTAKAAAEVLEAGGNAIDAAIAAAAMSCLAEPVLCSPGAGGFAMVSLPGQKPKLVDFFAHTPKRRNEVLTDGGMFPITAYYGTTTGQYLIGPGSSAVPGFIPGLQALYGLGATWSLSDLFSSTVKAARAGVPVSDFQAHIFEVVVEILNSTPKAQALFAPDSELLKAGERLVNPGLADAFELIASGPSGVETLNDAILETQREGNLRADDLDGYEAVVRDPLELELGGYRIYLNPYPAAGGLYIANTIGHLKAPESGVAADFVDIADALCATDADRLRSGGDLDVLAGLQPATRGTTHFSVTDAQGIVVSVTVSIGEGNGQIVGDFGFMLNNMMGESDVNPQGPTGWPLDTRLSSMMCPTIITHPDSTVSALGTGGSSRIRSVLSQAIARIASGSSLAEAIEAPRMHIEDGAFDIESHAELLDAEAVEELCQRFSSDHRVWPVSNMFFGGINAVEHKPCGELLAIGDPRRAGNAQAV